MISKNREIQLPKNFFDENPVKELSAAQLTYFEMIMMDLPDLNTQMHKIVASMIKRERREEYEKEKKKILEISNAEDIVNYMRKIKEPQNREVLLNKARDMQEDVMPLVLKRLMTSGHDVFIENAVILLGHADMKYVEQLYDVFRKIRSPYARSEASLVFGIKRKKEYAELLLEQFALINWEAPGTDYEQGPLLALYLIYGE